MSELPSAPVPQLATPQQIVRTNMRRILLAMLVYVLTTVVFYAVVSPLVIVAVGSTTSSAGLMTGMAVRTVIFGCAMGAILLTFPRDRQIPQDFSPLLEMAGIWPMDWSSRKSIQNSVYGVMLVGCILGWAIVETALSGTESRVSRGFFAEISNPLILVSADILVFVLSCLGAIWLWWNPQLQEEGRLQFSEQGMVITGILDRSYPAFVPWSDIKRAEVVGPSLKRLNLQVWHRPQRRILALRLPPLREQDAKELEELLEKHLEQEVPVSKEAPAPRQFHRLLERLGKRQPEQEGGLMAPEVKPPRFELSDAEFERLLIEDGVPLAPTETAPSGGESVDDAIPLAEFASDPEDNSQPSQPE